MKKICMALAFFILLILSSISIQAVGVAQEYLKDDTLYLTPGTSRLFVITLQNGDDEAIVVKLVLNSQIATIINPEEHYTIPAKFYDMHIRLNITIPENAEIDTLYSNSYYVQPIINTSGSMIPINLRINKRFFVKVVDENYQPEQTKLPAQNSGEEEKQEDSLVEQPQIIKKTILNEYFKGALILGIIIFVILFLWTKSSLLSIKLVRIKKNYRKRSKKR